MKLISLLEKTRKDAERISQKKAFFPDMQAENLWGSFVAELEVSKRKLETLENAQDIDKEIYRVAMEFQAVLKEPRAEATPSAILGASQFLAFLRGREMRT